MGTHAIYMTGNGIMAAGYREGDFVQIFGPPYSAPSLFASEFVAPKQLKRGEPYHTPCAGIWHIDLKAEDKAVGTITDFVVPEEACLVRRFETAQPLCMRLHPMQKGCSDFHYEALEEAEHGTEILIKTKNGNAVYNDYPLPYPQFYTLLVRGDASVERPAAFTYDVCVTGKAEMLLIGGPSYPECIEATERLRTISYEALLEKTTDCWKEIFNDVAVLREIPPHMPKREVLCKAIEDTVINIVVQQAQQGGVLAGYAYHMGYVRDQFGVCMAMLKLGLNKRARRMLQFYIDVFRHNGKILNAQAMGVDGMFHFAENDDSEITGYLLLQFFRYAQLTGDVKLLLDNVDFLQWLYDRQRSQLFNGTLPFNGDETYIAGGLLPRDVINDGSAEATMLFILSGHALVDFLAKYHLDQTGKLGRMRRTLQEVEAGYTGHFVVDGKYTLNDPTRTEGMELPKYRYGVCMNLGQTEGCDFFGWTQLSEGDVYLCPCCRNRRSYPKKRNELFHLPSALLMPAYLDAYLLDRELVTDYLQKLVEALEKDGHIYSDEANKKNVGYDYGLLLYNLVRHDMPGKRLVYDKLLSLLDETGAWSEYYVEDRHAGTRYRPWESGINIDALITYAKSL